MANPAGPGRARSTTPQTWVPSRRRARHQLEAMNKAKKEKSSRAEARYAFVQDSSTQDQTMEDLCEDVLASPKMAHQSVPQPSVKRKGPSTRSTIPEQFSELQNVQVIA